MSGILQMLFESILYTHLHKWTDAQMHRHKINTHSLRWKSVFNVPLLVDGGNMSKCLPQIFGLGLQ